MELLKKLALCTSPSGREDGIREIIKEEVKDENFSFSCEVELGMIPDYEPLKDLRTSIIVGKGVATINRSGFTYVGTKNGEDVEMFIQSKDLPSYGMCTDVSRFYTFYNGKFVEFYPNKPCVEKFFLATEEIHRLNGGKWQDFKFEK